MLLVLDHLAKKKAQTHNFADDEIAAFISSRLKVMREQKIRGNMQIEGELSNELITINLLAMAQDEHKNLRLPGLTIWVAMRLADQLKNIHSRKTRAQVRARLLDSAQSGMIRTVLNTVFNLSVLEQDKAQFKSAGTRYQRSEAVIYRLQQKETVDRMVKRSGDRLSVSIGYILVLLTSVILLYEYIIHS